MIILNMDHLLSIFKNRTKGIHFIFLSANLLDNPFYKRYDRNNNEFRHILTHNVLLMGLIKRWRYGVFGNGQ